MSQNSKYIRKSHNVTVLLYHIVSSAKYRRVVFTENVDAVLIKTCEEIEKRYEIHFLEIGTDADHVHFLVESVPSYSVTKIVTMIKSLTAREVFKQCLATSVRFMPVVTVRFVPHFDFAQCITLRDHVITLSR